ncbi:MAG: hypothetical protein PHS64_00270 [Candidatus Omnitrophica bacterium]|nr:hypothetical protein [Candidatus Omnitrophota bacterium]
MAANAYPLILYDNVFDDATPTATSTDTGYSVSNVIDWRPFTFWQEASVGTRYITINCGSAKAADTLAICGHNLCTANATVSLEYSTDNFAADVHEAIAGFVPTSDYAILKTFASVSKQYWRLKTVTAGATKAKIAILCVGARMDFTRYPYGDFDPCPEKLNHISGRSDAGYLLGVYQKNIGISIDVSFKNILPSWIESYFRPAWDAHLSLCKPFFWAWDITNHSSEVYLVNVPANFTLNTPFDPFRRSLKLKFEGIKE